MNQGKCLFYFLFACCFLQINGLDLDYYFGFDDALRSSSSCLSSHGQRNCEELCGRRMTYCSREGACYCLENILETPDGEVVVALRAHPDHRQLSAELHEFGENYYDFGMDSIRPGLRTKGEDAEYLSEELLLSSSEFKKPSLRHHIAHFCPNLDVARQCIWKCMEQGKPAFCGKDHVCYCGHKYSSHDKNIEKDPKTVYGQFQDLYTKYFGPNVEEFDEQLN